MGILIAGPGDTVIEQGKMTRDAVDKTMWAYTATADANCDHVKILVDIADLAEHITHETVEKDL